MNYFIWLNYPARIVWTRALKRTIGRVFLKKECCNGNVEGFRHAFMSKNSIFYWIFKTYKSRIKQYNDEKRSLSAKNIIFLEFKTPQEVNSWLKNLEV
jgi:adenylate kinase family enzyme